MNSRTQLQSVGVAAQLTVKLIVRQAINLLVQAQGFFAMLSPFPRLVAL